MKCHICYKIRFKKEEVKTFEIEGEQRNICKKCQEDVLKDSLKNIRIFRKG